MKKAQGMIVLISFLLLGIAIVLKNNYLIYFALAGFIVAIILKQVTINRHGTILGHPDRKKCNDHETDSIDFDVDGDSH